MADSLKLVGTKRVSGQTGSDLTISTPVRGGDQHKVRRWWNDNKNSALYVNCTKFTVSRAAGDVVLMVPSSADTRLDISFDGDTAWAFGPTDRAVSRVGIFTSGLDLIEEYVFPVISGGKVMKTTPAGGASYPS